MTRKDFRNAGKQRARFVKTWKIAVLTTILSLYGLARLLSISPCVTDATVYFAENQVGTEVQLPPTLPTLPTLTRSLAFINCTSSQIWIANVNAKISLARRIPNIVHQTSKSRCLTKKVAAAVNTWASLDDWSYLFHDDAAVMRLLMHDFPEFPHLGRVVRHCALHGTIKADLWRYLVLWAYGGIYADIDSAPANFVTQMIEVDDDAFFVVEQYHLLSQWFMASSPRHPLMYYAIQQCLTSLLTTVDTGAVAAAMVTGPHALHRAYMQFCKDGGTFIDSAVPGNKPVSAGRFVGSFNRTITVIGNAERQNEYVNRDVLGVTKKREFHKMGMRHFQDDKKHASGVSCVSSMLNAYYGSIQLAMQ